MSVRTLQSEGSSVGSGRMKEGEGRGGRKGSWKLTQHEGG